MSRPKFASSVLAASVAFFPLWQIPYAEAAGFEHGPSTLRQDVVLSGVFTATIQFVRQGIRPVHVFDLDATLFDTGGRHKAIMSEYARKVRRRHPKMLAKIEAWVPDELPYEVTETFGSLGITDPAEFKQAKDFWHKRFFSNDYLHYDTPIVGSVSYVRALRRAGSAIVYLTGRTDAQMRPGSLKTLQMAGYPVDREMTALIMNPHKGVRDAKFKGSEEVRNQIRALGTTIAIFDNEPGNVNELQRSFPDALTVFLDTNHSPGAPPVDPGIAWIKNFKWSWLTSGAERAAIAEQAASEPRTR